MSWWISLLVCFHYTFHCIVAFFRLPSSVFSLLLCSNIFFHPKSAPTRRRSPVIRLSSFTSRPRSSASCSSDSTSSFRHSTIRLSLLRMSWASYPSMPSYSYLHHSSHRITSVFQPSRLFLGRATAFLVTNNLVRCQRSIKVQYLEPPSVRSLDRQYCVYMTAFSIYSIENQLRLGWATVARAAIHIHVLAKFLRPLAADELVSYI